MPGIKCELFCCSNLEHLQEVYTGFRLLEKQGKLKLSYHIYKDRPTSLPEHSSAELFVRLNDTRLLLFDLLDFGDIREECLEQVDFCFKRSFSSRIIGHKLAYKRVFPLGLTYRVYEKYPSRFSLHRIPLEQSAGQRAKTLLWELLGILGLLPPRLHRPHIDNCSAEPDPSLPDGVVFMARLWDPSKTTKASERKNREVINSMRVECIRRLKRELGPLFIGGLIHNEYSSRYFPDCLLSDARLAYPGNYMRLVRQYPIGIATTGLHCSIGWKFAEYVALSRAIVSEKLHFEAPGLEAGKHYLEFTTADECVEAVLKLMQDRKSLAQMMYTNHEYYQTNVRPDMLIWNALATALENSR